MKITLICIITIIFVKNTLHSQNLIIVEGDGPPAFYTSVISAVSDASDGDVIYIPGGSYTIGTLIIDKQLTIIGAGYNPDSTSATGITSLNGFIQLATGCSGSIITGLYLTESFLIGPEDGPCVGTNVFSNVLISRCNFNSFNMCNLFLSEISTIIFEENIFRYEVNLEGGYSGFVFSKNVVGYKINGANNVEFNNNIFLNPGPYALLGNAINCTFNNNIFVPTINLTAGSLNNSVHNCLFTVPVGTIDYTFFSPDSSDNIYNVPIEDIFIEYSPDGNYFNDDYHLVAGSPGINAGVDGFDIGLYGTVHPFKEGAIPLNPHIQIKVIDAETTPEGDLPVQIRVSAQDN